MAKRITPMIEQHVAIYVRVSTTEQAASGLGLAVQEFKAREYARVLNVGGGLPVRVYADEGASAAKMDRPALQELLAAVKGKRVAAVVVLKIDRLSRSLRNLLELVNLFSESGVAFHAVDERVDTSSPSGRMMLSLLGTFAEFEREQCSSRTKAAIHMKKASGRAHGFTSFGQKVVDGRLVADEGDQEAAALMLRLNSEGKSYREIADALTAAGFATKRGAAKWSKQTVAAILGRVAA